MGDEYEISATMRDEIKEVIAMYAAELRPVDIAKALRRLVEEYD